LTAAGGKGLPLIVTLVSITFSMAFVSLKPVNFSRGSVPAA